MDLPFLFDRLFGRVSGDLEPESFSVSKSLKLIVVSLHSLDGRSCSPSVSASSPLVIAARVGTAEWASVDECPILSIS